MYFSDRAAGSMRGLFTVWMIAGRRTNKIQYAKYNTWLMQIILFWKPSFYWKWKKIFFKIKWFAPINYHCFCFADWYQISHASGTGLSTRIQFVFFFKVPEVFVFFFFHVLHTSLSFTYSWKLFPRLLKKKTCLRDVWYRQCCNKDSEERSIVSYLSAVVCPCLLCNLNFMDRSFCWQPCHFSLVLSRYQM